VNIFDILIVQPIFNLLIGLYSIIPGGDFGVSLIIFTVLVRFAMYPLLKKQLHQTKMMRKLQPELARIKKRTKGNKQLEGMQMLELYKKHGISPFRSIGLLLIQLPIFIALYYVIQIFTLHRDQIAKFTYDFMEGIGPIKQLIEHPDHFNEKLFGIVDLTKAAFAQGHVDIILVILAIAAAGTQFIMSKQTLPQTGGKKRLRDIMSEAAEGKQADQSEMNAVVMGKMMKVLPIFMFFVMISVPGALALYYAASNLVAVAQQSYLLKQDEEEMEDIADEPEKKKPIKKATAKAREKAAQEGAVTRVVARSDRKKKGKK
jgi:YidC/Oxa1 family membrane protein insertase